MEIVFRHFWLFFLVVMLINVALWRRRLAELVVRRHASRDETERFIRGARLAVIVVGLLGELTVLISGWPSALCIWTADIRSPGAIIGWGMSFGISALLLWWIWRGKGVTTLSRFGPAIFRRAPLGDEPYRPYPPGLVRAFVTFFVLAQTVGLFVMPVDATAFPGCPVATRASPVALR